MRDIEICLDQSIIYLLPSLSLGSQIYGTGRDQDTFLEELLTVAPVNPTLANAL